MKLQLLVLIVIYIVSVVSACHNVYEVVPLHKQGKVHVAAVVVVDVVVLVVSILHNKSSIKLGYINVLIISTDSIIFLKTL